MFSLLFTLLLTSIVYFWYFTPFLCEKLYLLKDFSFNFLVKNLFVIGINICFSSSSCHLLLPLFPPFHSLFLESVILLNIYLYFPLFLYFLPPKQSFVKSEMKSRLTMSLRPTWNSASARRIRYRISKWPCPIIKTI